MAEGLAPRYQDGGQVDALARVDPEHPNLTAAIERSLSADDATTAARLTWALWMYWWLRGHLAHGRRLAESVLEHQLPAGVLSRAELAAATMAFALDDVAAARRWWSSARAHAGDDPVAMANAVAGEGLAALAVGDLVEAAERFEHARSVAERAGPDGEWTRGLSLIWLGTVHSPRGRCQRRCRSHRAGSGLGPGPRGPADSYIALTTSRRWSWAEATTLAPASTSRRVCGFRGRQATTPTWPTCSTRVPSWRPPRAHARVPILLGAAQTIRESIGSRGYGYYRPDPAATEAAAREAQQHLGQDRYDDALDVGRRLHPSKPPTSPWRSRQPRAETRTPPGHLAVSVVWGALGVRVLMRRNRVRSFEPRSQRDHHPWHHNTICLIG